MNRWLNAVAAGAGIVAALPVLLGAQWPQFPAGTPTPATAPTPRTADGKPDLSDVWRNGRGPGGAARGAATPAAPANGPAPANAAAARGAVAPPAPALVSLDEVAPASFGNIGSGFKEGLPYQPWAAELVKQRMAVNSKDNPDAHCMPMGFMQFHNHPQLRKIIQTPKVLVLMYEANYGLRQIFTDGRPLPKDPDPWWYGYSVGKWEGDTLVVQTIGFNDESNYGPIWLDVRGSPLTNAGKVTERFTRPNYGTLEIQITVDDPKAYTRPWTVRVTQRIAETELNEFICEDRDASHYVGPKQ
jgi:hypothetical protein